MASGNRLRTGFLRLRLKNLVAKKNFFFLLTINP